MKNDEALRAIAADAARDKHGVYTDAEYDAELIRLAREDEREAMTKWHQERYEIELSRSIESVAMDARYYRNKGRADAHSDAVDFITERGKP